MSLNCTVKFVLSAVDFYLFLQMFLMYDEVTTVAGIPIRNGKPTVEAKSNYISLESEDTLSMVKNGVVKLKVCVTDVHSSDMESIRITNVAAKWTEGLLENSVRNLSLDMRSGHVNIIRPVGSGKV